MRGEKRSAALSINTRACTTFSQSWAYQACLATKLDCGHTKRVQFDWVYQAILLPSRDSWFSGHDVVDNLDCSLLYERN